MNPEFEKLFDAAFADGFISPKELAVLKKKALKLGMSEGEIEIMITARQYVAKEGGLKDENKCPNCGGEIDLKKDFSCPNCSYSLLSILQGNTTPEVEETDADYYLKGLQKTIHKYRGVPKSELQGNGWQMFKWFKIIFTGGLYIPYKLILKKEPVFDGYRVDSQIREAKITVYAAMINYTTKGKGAVAESAEYSFNEWKKDVRNKRIKAFFVSLLWFVFFGLPLYGIYVAVKKFSDNRKEVAAASIYTREELARKAESLISAGDTAGAIKTYTSYKGTEPDMLYTKGVTAFLEHHKFEEAKQLAEKIIGTEKENALKQVALAETLYKYTAKN